MKKRALLIGINEYDFLGPLSFARKDAEDFAAALKDRCGFQDNELTIMTCGSKGGLRGDSSYIEHKLTDLTEFRDLDLLIFGFWGHGFAPAGGRRYLCGLNAQDDDLERSAVSLDVVKAKLVQVGALNTLLVLDCCQNRPAGRGASVDLEEGAEEQFAAMARDIQTSRKKKSSKGVPTTAIMNSCREGQRAFEWEDRNNGIFTAHLLDGLAQGKASIAQLAAHVCDHTPETARKLYRKEQVPWFFIEGRGDIVLPGRKGPPPQEERPARWWITMKGDERGPLNEAGVLALIESGEVRAGDKCWHEGMSGWREMGKATEWAGRFVPEVEKPSKPPSREPAAIILDGCENVPNAKITPLDGLSIQSLTVASAPPPLPQTNQKQKTKQKIRSQSKGMKATGVAAGISMKQDKTLPLGLRRKNTWRQYVIYIIAGLFFVGALFFVIGVFKFYPKPEETIFYGLITLICGCIAWALRRMARKRRPWTDNDGNIYTGLMMAQMFNITDTDSSDDYD